MHRTLSRLLSEATIIAGSLSILIGLLLKLTTMTSIYAATLLGLTISDYMNFGAVCFLFSIALTARRLLKHIELKLNDKTSRNY
jgi:hypothetical protein